MASGSVGANMPHEARRNPRRRNSRKRRVCRPAMPWQQPEYSRNQPRAGGAGRAAKPPQQIEGRQGHGECPYRHAPRQAAHGLPRHPARSAASIADELNRGRREEEREIPNDPPEARSTSPSTTRALSRCPRRLRIQARATTGASEGASCLLMKASGRGCATIAEGRARAASRSDMENASGQLAIQSRSRGASSAASESSATRIEARIASRTSERTARRKEAALKASVTVW